MHDIIIAIIGCGLLNVIVTAVINRSKRLKDLEDKIDKVDKRIDATDKHLQTAEKDALRTQLLVLMCDYPDNIEGIMEVARHYFVTLKGNWYMTALFNKWLEQENIAKPEWFEKGD